MKAAWSDAGLTSKFNSTMMQHTIVMKAWDPMHHLDVEDLKALARGMDHSVRIAESTYYHQKEKLNIDHSKIMREFWSWTTGLKNWQRGKKRILKGILSPAKWTCWLKIQTRSSRRWGRWAQTKETEDWEYVSYLLLAKQNWWGDYSPNTSMINSNSQISLSHRLT